MHFLASFLSTSSFAFVLILRSFFWCKFFLDDALPLIKTLSIVDKSTSLINIDSENFLFSETDIIDTDNYRH